MSDLTLKQVEVAKEIATWVGDMNGVHVFITSREGRYWGVVWSAVPFDEVRQFTITLPKAGWRHRYDCPCKFCKVDTGGST